MDPQVVGAVPRRRMDGEYDAEGADREGSTPTSPTTPSRRPSCGDCSAEPAPAPSAGGPGDELPRSAACVAAGVVTLAVPGGLSGALERLSDAPGRGPARSIGLSGDGRRRPGAALQERPARRAWRATLADLVEDPQGGDLCDDRDEDPHAEERDDPAGRVAPGSGASPSSRSSASSGAAASGRAVPATRSRSSARLGDSAGLTKSSGAPSARAASPGASATLPG